MYACIYVSMHVYMNVRVYGYWYYVLVMCVFNYVCMLRMYLLYVCINIYVYGIMGYVFVCIYVYMHASTYVCMYAFLYVRI